MKILIIGDNPQVTGGVCNYTRPLFDKLSKIEKIYYLYSSSRVNPDYNLLFNTKILKDTSYRDGDVYKIINSDNLTKNYDNLALDISSEKNDNVFEKFIIEIKPDVIHIHEIIGFSSNMISIAKKYNTKVYVTVHEYWWLCPHRVMVDFDRKICEGPSDMHKCSYCVHLQRKHHPKSSYTKFRFALKNQFPKMFDVVSYGKGMLTSFRKETPNAVAKENLSFGNHDYSSFQDKKLEDVLSARLNNNIEALNLCDKVIGVSQDVKNILTKYGVQPEKIIVQHIGSNIAEISSEHNKQVDENKIVFGFIGGVGYYKGVHQLVEAFISMPDEYKSKAIVDIYGTYSEGYVKAIKEDILGDKKYSSHVIFHGRYQHSLIGDITNKIDISVLPSLCADTAPQTIFESFSSGLPIIAPKVGGFSDFVIDNENGLLYEAASVADLKNKMMYIIDNPKKLDIFTRNIKKSKTLDENIDELLALYRSK
ncbi:MAG TPA: glycosyltransferase [Arcobacter sp.]|nr:glycosyltransferase [Arcobacter sp.]